MTQEEPHKWAEVPPMVLIQTAFQECVEAALSDSDISKLAIFCTQSYMIDGSMVDNLDIYKFAREIAARSDDSRDAARYRWLRNSETLSASMINKMGESLDAAIDAAMAAQGESCKP